MYTSGESPHARLVTTKRRYLVVIVLIYLTQGLREFLSTYRHYRVGEKGWGDSGEGQAGVEPRPGGGGGVQFSSVSGPEPRRFAPFGTAGAVKHSRGRGGGYLFMFCHFGRLVSTSPQRVMDDSRRQAYVITLCRSGNTPVTTGSHLLTPGDSGVRGTDKPLYHTFALIISTLNRSR